MSIPNNVAIEIHTGFRIRSNVYIIQLPDNRAVLGKFLFFRTFFAIMLYNIKNRGGKTQRNSLNCHPVTF